MKGDPEMPLDTTLTGEDEMWQKVDIYLRYCDDHVYIFEREHIRAVIKFLDAKAHPHREMKPAESVDLQEFWLTVARAKAAMLERRILQMVGSHSDDPQYYINACQAALRALELPPSLLK